MSAMPATKAVTWRQATATLAAVACCLTALVIVVRADGLPAVDAASSQATRWFAHQDRGRVVLVDGFGGRAIASLEAATAGDDLLVAQGAGAAYVLNDSTGEARPIDTAELRLGSPTGISALGGGRAVAKSSTSGLLVADRATGTATLLPLAAEAVDIPFPIEATASASPTVRLAADGAVWSLVDGSLQRSTSVDTTAEDLGISGGPDAALSLVGNRPLVLDRVGRRARLGDGAWIDLPGRVDASDMVLQEPGPRSECGWVGAGDDLWCIDERGIAERSTVEGLSVDGSSTLAIAGDAAALVRRGPTQVVQFDWRAGALLDRQEVSVASNAALDVTSTVDVVWIDHRDGDLVWSVHPWGIQAVDKDDPDLLVMGEDGDVVEDTDDGEPGTAISGEGSDGIFEPPAADDDGIDDPPVAGNDQVTARTGSAVSIDVTANDYDPDGEAIAVVDVGSPTHGTVVISTASSVAYTPNTGYVGTDEFEYTITDAGGNQATATVSIELLTADATNRPPVGLDDTAQTGPGADVVVDVLLNDIDPERDALAIDTFSQPVNGGEVQLAEGPTGLPALEFSPDDGFEGEATFTYRPADVFAAVGDDVVVRVEVARPTDGNRPPVARPDAVRLRRNDQRPLKVLANDSDPDGDALQLDALGELPPGLEVVDQGGQLGITARSGSNERMQFDYEIEDGNGNTARTSVLVVVDSEPNRPPIATPDIQTAVVGQTILIDVTANDVDPDNDPITVIGVSQPADRTTVEQTTVELAGENRVEFTATAVDPDGTRNRRFTYTVTDGHGHEVVGEVTVTVLDEALPDPPFAQDDSTYTFVNEAVTIDVLRNDGDPSGERPQIVSVGCPGGGDGEIVDQQVRYTPPRDDDGSFRCTYEITNSQGRNDRASIIVSVRIPDVANEPPRAVNDFLTLEVDTTGEINVAGNDIDPDGEPGELRVTSSTRPNVGEAERRGNVITYTAGPVPGNATIDYQVEDPGGAIATGRLVIRITEAANQPPRARPDNSTIQGRGGDAVFDLLANDFDPDETEGGLSVVRAALDDTSNAAFALSGSRATVSPAADFVGTLTGSYTIADGEGLEASSTFTVVVTDPPNRPPIAADDVASVANGGSVTAPVLFNDSDPDGDPLSLTITSGPDPALGAASITGDRSISFSAVPGATGTASIGYEISDGELADTATLRITVRPCSESAPVAASAFLETGYRQPVTVDLDDYAQNGSVTDVSGPSGYQGNVYTPPAGFNGNVAIDYTVVNECQQRAFGSITIDVNQSPIGQDQAITLGRNDSREITVGQLASDDEPLVITASSGAPAWVTTNSDRLVIAPGPSVADGTYTWLTTISDPGGLTTTVSVAATISNEPPIATADTIDVSDGQPRTKDLVENDRDPDGSNGSLRVQSVPSSITFTNGATGTLTLTADGRGVRLDPGSGQGQASFDYRVVDSSGAVSAPASVVVTGPVVNAAPSAGNKTVEVTARTRVTITLTATDPDGDALSIGTIDDPSGVVVERPGGLEVVVLAPSPGTFTFSFDVVDARKARSNTATVTVDAAPPPTTTTTTVPPTTTTVPPTTTTTTVPPTTTTTVPPTTTTTTTTLAPTTTTTRPRGTTTTTTLSSS